MILAAMVAAGVILYISDLFSRRKAAVSDNGEKNLPATSEDAAGSDGETDSEASGGGSCCGLHLICEKEADAALKGEPIYYDDEELDRFAGRLPGEYTEDETEEFRDILLTMLPEDVPGWARSLDRRGIRPPEAIRAEIMLLLE